MNLTTKTFSYSKLLHFKLTILLFLRNRWKIFALFLILAIIPLIFGQVLLSINILSISILWALVVILLSWIRINSLQNFKYYQSRYVTINNLVLHLHIQENQYYQMDLNNLTDTVIESNYLLLIFTKQEFVYIPFHALKDKMDKLQLLEIKTKGKKK